MSLLTDADRAEMRASLIRVGEAFRIALREPFGYAVVTLPEIKTLRRDAFLERGWSEVLDELPKVWPWS